MTFIYVLLLYAKNDYSSTITVRHAVYKTEASCKAHSETLKGEYQKKFTMVQVSCAKDEVRK